MRLLALISAWLLLIASLSPAQEVVTARRRAPSGGGGEPTFTVVQAFGYGTIVTTGTTWSYTFTNTPTTGNAVVCGISEYPGTTVISSVKDNAGTPNSYTFTPASIYHTSAVNAAGVAYLLNLPSGAGKTITVTTATPVTFDSVIGCEEVDRSSGTWSFDADAGACTNAAGSGGCSAATTTVTVPAATAANTGEFAFSFIGTSGSSSVSSSSSPWTQIGVTGSGYFETQHNLAAPSGSVAAGWVLGATSAGTNGVVALFK